MEKIEPFNDSYFNGLDYEQIAGLAKKSIRITTENCKLEHKYEDLVFENKALKDELDELKEKYLHVLELAKTNADSNDYCLQELEKENDSMKKILVDIGFWDVNGNYREDFQKVERSEFYYDEAEES